MEDKYINDDDMSELSMFLCDVGGDFGPSAYEKQRVVEIKEKIEATVEEMHRLRNGIESAINILDPRRKQIQERADAANKAGDVDTYGYGLLCGQAQALSSALYHLSVMLLPRQSADDTD